ncbi:FecCD family ABC transporter permease [Microbacterium sp.]|uniref:FecCD family ABC transporter permease n=1 Tax=Microbacterium sp. TaxID=51671 RepID=UPI0039E3873D
MTAAGATRRRDVLGTPSYVVRTPATSFLAARRWVLACAALAVAVLALGVVDLGIGEIWISPPEIVAALADDSFAHTVVVQWRMPRIAAAIVFGAALGLSGAILQTLTRNPLGSPDLVGLDAGAYTAVAVTILVFGIRDAWSISAAAIAGAALVSAVIYLLAWRRGIQGFRLIVVGIAVSAMLGAFNTYLITRADAFEAVAVGMWGAGSLTKATWGQVGPAAVLIAALFIVAAVIWPRLQQLELGDDAARSHGVGAGTARLGLLAVCVVSIATVTAVSGPIAFIALAAPQIGQRVTGSAGLSLAGSALTGAVLLVAADVLSVTSTVFVSAIPVGLVSLCLGGVYLAWLLVRETRRSRGGAR